MTDATLAYDQAEPTRLDRYLNQRYPNFSRSQIGKIIASGAVRVNAKPAKASLKLKPGDLITFGGATFTKPVPAAIKLPIIYEDDFCIVINKPSGVITHSKGGLSSEPSVASFIGDKIGPELTGNRAGIVHRLDRGTSGVIVAAKTEAAAKYLQRQFAKRQVKKTYYGVVTGDLDRTEAEIDMPLERNPKQPSSFRAGPNGKPALTRYRVIARKSGCSLLELTPTTGRTHQLRVHLKSIGHPIVGDTLYGGEPADRLLLHAARLSLILPDRGRCEFEAPLPPEFTQFAKLD